MADQIFMKFGEQIPVAKVFDSGLEFPYVGSEVRATTINVMTPRYFTKN